MKRETVSGREQFFLEQLHIAHNRSDGAPSLEGTGEPKQVPEHRGNLESGNLEELLTELDQDDRRILEDYPSEVMIPRIMAGAGVKSGVIPFAGKARFLPLLAAALFTVLAGLQFFGPWAGTELPPGVERIKGMEPSLRIYRAGDGKAELLNEGAVAETFDLLQLEYNGAGAGFGAIVSLDGRGAVTLHYPGSPEDVPQLDSGSVLLPYAYQLDNAPRFERFFFVTSREEFSPGTILAAARRLLADSDNATTGRLDIPDRFEQTSVTILKEEIR